MKTKSTPTLDPTKCSKKVDTYSNGWYRGSHQCKRKWSIVAKDGKHYCRQHDPDATKKREALSTANYEYDMAITAMGWFGCALYDALYKIMRTGNISAPSAKKTIKAAHKYREILRKGKPK